MTQVPAVEVPAYLAEGRGSSTPARRGERYIEKLTAPVNHPEWFDHFGHNPCCEEPDRFNTFMIDTALAGTSPSGTTAPPLPADPDDPHSECRVNSGARRNG